MLSHDSQLHIFRVTKIILQYKPAEKNIWYSSFYRSLRTGYSEDVCQVNFISEDVFYQKYSEVVMFLFKTAMFFSNSVEIYPGLCFRRHGKGFACFEIGYTAVCW